MSILAPIPGRAAALSEPLEFGIYGGSSRSDLPAFPLQIRG
jgi:hypothetical protein